MTDAEGTHASEPAAEKPKVNDEWEDLGDYRLAAHARSLDAGSGMSPAEIRKTVGADGEPGKGKKARKRAARAALAGSQAAHPPITSPPQIVQSTPQEGADELPEVHELRDPTDDSVSEYDVSMVRRRAEAMALQQPHITYDQAVEKEWGTFYALRAARLGIFLKKDLPLPHLRPPHVQPEQAPPQLPPEYPESPTQEEPF